MHRRLNPIVRLGAPILLVAAIAWVLIEAAELGIFLYVLGFFS